LKNTWKPNPGAALSVHIEIQKVPRISDKKVIFNTRNRMCQGLTGIYYDQFSKLWL